jgi:hypothetical protein
MSEKDLELFYNRLTEITQAKGYDISHAARTIAVFRVAIEYGATMMGFPVLTYLMAKLLTMTLGIMAGDESATYEDILDDFEEEDQLKH